MTPEQLAQDAAARAERLAIEKARESLGAFAGRLHRHLDERTERNCHACPHLNVTTSRHAMLGTEFVATCCDACGLWLPESAAGEGERG